MDCTDSHVQRSAGLLFSDWRGRRRGGGQNEKTLARAAETHRGFGKPREKGRFGDEFS